MSAKCWLTGTSPSWVPSLLFTLIGGAIRFRGSDDWPKTDGTVETTESQPSDELYATFFEAAFFATAGSDPDTFFNAAHLFFAPAAIFRRAAALIFRFGLVVCSLTMGPDSCLTLAHLAFCASAIRFRAATLTLRLGRAVMVGSAGSLPPLNKLRRSAIWPSMRFFSASKPAIAAAIISGESFLCGM